MKRIIDGVDVVALRQHLVLCPDSTRMVSHQRLSLIARHSKSAFAEFIVGELFTLSKRFVRYTQRFQGLCSSGKEGRCWWSLKKFMARCARLKLQIELCMLMLRVFLGRLIRWPFDGIRTKVIAEKLTLTGLVGESFKAVPA
jgi:hypothetical protein